MALLVYNLTLVETFAKIQVIVLIFTFHGICVLYDHLACFDHWPASGILNYIDCVKMKYSWTSKRCWCVCYCEEERLFPSTSSKRIRNTETVPFISLTFVLNLNVRVTIIIVDDLFFFFLPTLFLNALLMVQLQGLWVYLELMFL